MKLSTRSAPLVLLMLAACGGETVEESHTTVESAETTAGREREAQANESVQVQGLMGTISSMAVQRGVEPKMNRFLRCFTERYDHVEVLGGHFEMAFRIARDGTVLWVYPRASTIGDRETERCLIDVAATIRFSEPHGGEAEFAYPIELDPPEDVRPPTFWDPSRVADSVERQSSRMRCDGDFAVTVYIEPGGDVIAAGASSAEQVSAEQLDCVTEAVAGWTMPNPGSYPAKVTFEL
ncbi:MAG: AgmX/PglI C-terminal domain-containing protein [Polyangiales bacterium]